GASFCDDLHRTPGDGNLLHASVGEETNPAAVRGPEWILAILRSVELTRDHVVHGSQPQHGFGAWCLRAENQGTAIGRQRKRWDVHRRVEGCREVGPFRWEDREADRFAGRREGGRSGGKEQCDAY